VIVFQADRFFLKKGESQPRVLSHSRMPAADARDNVVFSLQAVTRVHDVRRKQVS